MNVDMKDYMAYQQGYEAGKRDAAPRWHRVEEELPNEKGPYITAYYDGYVGENVWHFIGETAVGWMYDADAVRYWMTMPEPPKEDADANK